MVNKIEKLVALILLISASVLAIVGMIAGPLGSSVISLGASISAAIIALAFVVFVMLEKNKF